MLTRFFLHNLHRLLLSFPNYSYNLPVDYQHWRAKELFGRHMYGNKGDVHQDNIITKLAHLINDIHIFLWIIIYVVILE